MERGAGSRKKIRTPFTLSRKCTTNTCVERKPGKRRRAVYVLITITYIFRYSVSIEYLIFFTNPGGGWTFTTLKNFLKLNKSSDQQYVL